MLNTLIKVSSALVLLYAAIVAILSFDAPQRSLMFLHWVRLPLYPRFDMPEYYGFGHNQGRNIKIQTSDNVTIHAWHFLPKEYYDKHQLRAQSDVDKTIFDNALADYQYDTLIYFHGNALHRAAPWRVDLYKQLLLRFGRINLIAIEYRGFGDSESTPSEFGLHLDAQALLKWLNHKKVSNDRISLIGHSLGTGVATTLAYDMSLSDKPPKSLILKAGYSSMATLIFEYNVLPFLPILAPIKRFPQLEQWLLSKLNHRFDSLSKIEHVNCPVLIIYGAGDLEIPIANSHRLFQRALHQNDASLKELVHQGQVSRTVVPHEGIVYKASKKPSVTMVELEYGNHNNVGYFDLSYQSIEDILAGTE